MNPTDKDEEHVREPRRARSPARDKPGNDAKGLKPPILDVQMPALQLNDWFKQFENYQAASGWGRDSHRIQMAYLRPILSEEIRTAITFDHKDTVNEALRAVK